MHDCICRHITGTPGDVEYAGAGCELHAEPCTCAPLNVELSGDLVVGILLCIHTRLQTHDRIECVLAAGANKCASVCDIGHTEQRYFLCTRYLLISSSISEYPGPLQSASDGRVLHNCFFLVLNTHSLGVCVLEILDIYRVALISERKSATDGLFNIIVYKRTHCIIVTGRIQHVRLWCKDVCDKALLLAPGLVGHGLQAV